MEKKLPTNFEKPQVSEPTKKIFSEGQLKDKPTISKIHFQPPPPSKPKE